MIRLIISLCQSFALEEWILYFSHFKMQLIFLKFIIILSFCWLYGWYPKCERFTFCVLTVLNINLIAKLAKKPNSKTLWCIKITEWHRQGQLDSGTYLFQCNLHFWSGVTQSKFFKPICTSSENDIINLQWWKLR